MTGMASILSQFARDVEPNVALMLGQRRRRWINIKATLDWHFVFIGKTWNAMQVYRLQSGVCDFGEKF